MISKEKILEQLKKLGCQNLKFYYRTKTIFNEKLTTIYLIFIPNYVILAITDPRNVEREELKLIEKIPFEKLVFFKEDNMYLLMKWKDKHLLIGFKEKVNLDKFCSKLCKFDINFGKRSKKRVLGNDDGESVSYKLDNESIDHISTDTEYEVLSFETEKNESEMKNHDQEERHENTRIHKIMKNKDTKKSAFQSSTDSKQSISLRQNERKSGFDKNSSTNTSINSVKTKIHAKNRSINDKCKKSAKADNSKIHLEKSLKVVKKNELRKKNELKRQKLKSYIEFGCLNFFLLTKPDFQDLCTGIMLRLCEHFDQKSNKKIAYSINLLDHFSVFIRINKRLFKIETKEDFTAAIYDLKTHLDIVIQNKEEK